MFSQLDGDINLKCCGTCDAIFAFGLDIEANKLTNHDICWHSLDILGYFNMIYTGFLQFPPNPNHLHVLKQKAQIKK